MCGRTPATGFFLCFWGIMLLFNCEGCMAPIRTEDWKSPHIPCALVPFLDVAETAGNELAAAFL